MGMESREVIDRVESIYNRFNVIENLRLHMRTVAAVGSLLMDHWKGTAVSPVREDAVAALLLHDLGNIVKFNFGDRSLWNGMSDEEIEWWRTVRDDVVAKYHSTVDHEVTNRMAEQLELSDRLLFLISAMLMENAEAVIDSRDIELKICAYADQRVAPWGIATLSERFSDLTRRYSDTPEGYFEGRLLLAQQLESDVLASTTILPGDINEESVRRYLVSISGNSP